MTEDSVRYSKGSSYTSETQSDAIVSIPILIAELYGENASLHIPALRHLLDIIIDYPDNIEFVIRYKLTPVLIKFVKNVEPSEKFALSSTILQMIGLRSQSDDKISLVRLVLDPIILMINSKVEEYSKAGSKALCDLIEESEIIRNSVLSTQFALIIQQILIYGTNITQQSSFSSQIMQTVTSHHAVLGILDVLLKIVTISIGLEPLAILIPTLDELNKSSDINIKIKAGKIKAQMQAEGINFTSLSNFNGTTKLQQEQNDKENKRNILQQKDKEQQKVEEINKKDEELKLLKDETSIFKLSNSKTKEQNGIQKQKIFQDIIIPIAIINNDKLELNLSDVDEVAKRINKKSNKDSTFSLKKIMENGIYALEIQFLNTDIYTIGIGIVKDTYNIPEGSYPNSNPNIQHIAFYGGINLNGGIFYQGSITQGNAPFKENQMIRAEFDSEKGTLCFFIDGKQQPVFISGIKEKIRFMIHMHNKDAVCIIHSLKQIAVPTAGHVAGEKSVQW